MKTQGTSREGALSLIEILVIIAVLALLVGLLLPARRGKPIKASQINCVNNLKQVGISFRIWGDDRLPMQVSVTNGGTMEMVAVGIVFPHFQVMSNELSTPKILHCPADHERTNARSFTRDFNDSKLSYFVGVDAKKTEPTMIVAGDRNVTAEGKPVSRGLSALGTNRVVGWTSQMHK